MEREIKT
jgi:hypothetical protein